MLLPDPATNSGQQGSDRELYTFLPNDSDDQEV